MAVYLRLGVGSAILALVLTPAVARGSMVLGLVDAPGGRKVHAQSLPRVAGWPVVAASILGMILALIPMPGRLDPDIWTALRPLALAGDLILAVGLLDDIRGAPLGVPRVRPMLAPATARVNSP